MTILEEYKFHLLEKIQSLKDQGYEDKEILDGIENHLKFSTTK